MSTKKRQVRKIEKDGEIIAFKVNKNDLEHDFEGYWENMCKALDTDSLKMQDYDDTTVIAYDRNETFGY